MSTAQGLPSTRATASMTSATLASVDNDRAGNAAEIPAAMPLPSSSSAISGVQYGFVNTALNHTPVRGHRRFPYPCAWRRVPAQYDQCAPAMSRALQTVPLIRMEPPYTIGHPFHTQTSAALPIGSGKNLFLSKGSCRRNPTHYREMMNPPSMKITCPFTKSAAGERGRPPPKPLRTACPSVSPGYGA